MEVFNVEVAGEHNFFAAGVLTHNARHGGPCGSDDGPCTLADLPFKRGSSADRKDDTFHRFPRMLDALVSIDEGVGFTGGDGSPYTLYDLPGEVNGRRGTYEWIVDAAGCITHRFFNSRRK